VALVDRQKGVAAVLDVAPVAGTASPPATLPPTEATEDNMEQVEEEDTEEDAGQEEEEEDTEEDAGQVVEEELPSAGTVFPATFLLARHPATYEEWKQHVLVKNLEG
jgi:hypothetical protein